MYCPNCANEVNPDLHYCNGCGFRLGEDPKAPGKSFIGNVTTGASFVGMAGLIAFIFVLKMMLEWRTDPALMVIISLGYLATVFGICAYTLSFIKVFHKSESSDVQIRRPSQPELSGKDTNRLEEARQQPASVIDNTTRTLDEVQLERD
ncbi:MAG: zinc ribbon domain-containing protein [Pyrinomonadaceae bacterium]|nr:zinc ribbon domain-containing protein [Pyrinomonadaceae bacterium]